MSRQASQLNEMGIPGHQCRAFAVWLDVAGIAMNASLAFVVWLDFAGIAMNASLAFANPSPAMRNPSSVSKNPSLQHCRTFPREDNGVLGLLSEKSIENGPAAALSLDRCSEENGGAQRLGLLSEMRMERVLDGEIWTEI
ncbi:hypothetical protein MRB53_034979 [Persea americana]|uniref:Uncharacterized protein n=1 Tax=Persea americana TaxID=3435 RepID=A0ACC2K3J7_PERAE|nr:hypothetical protein MRB53_034979 [Persea americana]